MIQNVLYLLGCLTFRIYFLICFWPHSFYYETIFYYLIHVLFFYMEVLLDLICLLYKFGMLIWQIIILLMILLHVWSSVLVWAFYYSASYLIIFLKYVEIGVVEKSHKRLSLKRTPDGAKQLAGQEDRFQREGWVGTSMC